MLTTAQAQWVSTGTKALTLTNATLIGAVPPSTPMHINVGLKIRNASEIQTTLKRMVTVGDSLYGTSLTTEQFIAQYAPTAAQVQAVENYLSSYGFKNLSIEGNQLLIQADGTAADVEAAFNTALAKFSQNGATIIANTLDAQVPQSLSGSVLAVLGLNNIKAMRSTLRKSTDPCDPLIPYPAPGSCPPPAVANSTFTPQQYQIAYDAAYPGTTPGATSLKQKITSACNTAIGSIAEGNMGCLNKSTNCPVPTSSTGKEIVVSGTPSAYSTGVIRDLYNYETNYKLPIDPLTIVYAGIPSPDTAGAIEWDLDSQTSIGIAQQVSRYYFYVSTSLTDSDLALAIDKYAEDNKAKLMSISLGECEFFPYVDGSMLVDDEAFAEAALQGQTTFVSSDDNGSACPVAPTNGVPGSGAPDVSYPASSPYVIAVGATDLFTNSNSNYTYDYELGAEFSGGGNSGFETSPFWENGVVPSATAGARGLPDTAMCGEPNFCGAIIYTGADPKTGSGSSQLCCVGGTSLSSPLAMGAYGRIETAHSNNRGFAGPLIYQLSSGPAPGPGQTIRGFNDVVAGANGLYNATPGWDYVTGLGSWDILAIDKIIPSTYSH